MGNHSLRKQTYPYQRSWGFPVRDLCCLQPWQVERLILLFPPVLSSPLLCQSLPVFSFFDSFSCLSVSSFFLLPSFFPLLCSLSLSVCLPFFSKGDAAQRRSGLAADSGSPHVYGSGKRQSHFLLFCLKLATGVAYLSRTEILEVVREGVSVIVSSPIISFMLINV